MIGCPPVFGILLRLVHGCEEAQERMHALEALHHLCGELCTCCKQSPLAYVMLHCSLIRVLGGVMAVLLGFLYSAGCLQLTFSKPCLQPSVNETV